MGGGWLTFIGPSAHASIHLSALPGYHTHPPRVTQLHVLHALQVAILQESKLSVLFPALKRFFSISNLPNLAVEKPGQLPRLDTINSVTASNGYHWVCGWTSIWSNPSSKNWCHSSLVEQAHCISWPGQLACLAGCALRSLDLAQTCKPWHSTGGGFWSTKARL